MTLFGNKSVIYSGRGKGRKENPQERSKINNIINNK